MHTVMKMYWHTNPEPEQDLVVQGSGDVHTQAIQAWCVTWNKNNMSLKQKVWQHADSADADVSTASLTRT